MPGHDIIVIGASAGGLEALQGLVAGLPRDLPAALFVVWHIPAHSLGVLPEVLERAGPLPAAHAHDGEQIRAGRIYVAPPDRHLLVEHGHVRLTRGPKENHFRPAVDPLFRSAAHAYGPRVIGVVLTGTLDDGTAGLWAVKDRRGLAVVQDPDEALYASMPRSAMEHVDVDYAAPVREMGRLLADLAHMPATEEGGHPVSDELEIENRIAMEDNALEIGIMKLGTISSYTCPDCHGILLQLNTGGVLRFRCHTGHAFSAGSLVAQVSESIEESLWNARRALDEGILLLRHLEQHARNAGDSATADRFLQKMHEAEQQAQAVRQAVLQHARPAEVESR